MVSKRGGLGWGWNRNALVGFPGELPFKRVSRLSCIYWPDSEPALSTLVEIILKRNGTVGEAIYEIRPCDVQSPYPLSPSILRTLPFQCPRQRCGVGPGGFLFPGVGRTPGLAPRAGWGRGGMGHSSRVHREESGRREVLPPTEVKRSRYSSR